MKNHKDLLEVLRSNKLRITQGRRLIFEFILDNKLRRISLDDVHGFLNKQLGAVVPFSIDRKLQVFQKLDRIQELNLL